jgi:hypothetical protein
MPTLGALQLLGVPHLHAFLKRDRPQYRLAVRAELSRWHPITLAFLRFVDRWACHVTLSAAATVQLIGLKSSTVVLRATPATLGKSPAVTSSTGRNWPAVPELVT